MKYHLILTMDYELFGNGSGCIEKCLIAPTNRLASIVESYEAKLSLFVETLELACYKSLPTMKDQYKMIEDQLCRLVEHGHRLELHVHPQWLNAKYEQQEWNLALDKWRIGDLSPAEIQECMTNGLSFLAQFENDLPAAFRAGGWAIQPSAEVLATLSRYDIKIDSTVAPGICNPSKGDWYDFRSAPDLPFWKVSSDICEENPTGDILEVPITTQNIGVAAHLRALRELRSYSQFPENCHGSYDGPNGIWQSLRGRLSKLSHIGRVMLDFSTLPGWALIEVTERHMDHFQIKQAPIPIVAIGHNKNFSQKSGENLNQFLDWARACSDIVFSDYRRWKTDGESSKKSIPR